MNLMKVLFEFDQAWLLKNFGLTAALFRFCGYLKPDYNFCSLFISATFK